jgi:ribonuclease P protein component
MAVKLLHPEEPKAVGDLLYQTNPVTRDNFLSTNIGTMTVPKVSGLSKSERLCHKKIIERLFNKEGESITDFPLRFIYLRNEFVQEVPAQVMFPVSVRNFKKAVDRNYVRRRLREIYRLNKQSLYGVIGNERHFALALMYLSKELSSFERMNISYQNILNQFAERLRKNID